MAIEDHFQDYCKLYFLNDVKPKRKNIWQMIQKEQKDIFCNRYCDGIDYRLVEDNVPFEILKNISSKIRNREDPEISLVFVVDAKKYKQDRIEIHNGGKFLIRDNVNSPILAYDILQDETLNTFCVYRSRITSMLSGHPTWEYFDGPLEGYSALSHRFQRLLSEYESEELKQQAEYKTGIGLDLLLFLREKVIENMNPKQLKNTLIHYLK